MLQLIISLPKHARSMHTETQLFRIFKGIKKRHLASDPSGDKKELCCRVIGSSLPGCGEDLSSSSQQSMDQSMHLSAVNRAFWQRTVPDVMRLVDLYGRDVDGKPRRVFHDEKSFKLGRACVDQFATEKEVNFCRLYKVSDWTKSILIPRQQEEAKENSPSTPFYNNPSLGIDVILNSVFRCRGKFASGLGAEVFSSWVACPPGRSHKALAFSAGHCFSNNLEVPFSDEGPFDFANYNFSEVLGCFGSEVGSSEFNTVGFSCSTKPLAIANYNEDLALFEIAVENVEILLPCSLSEECKNHTFIAAYSYPCAPTFLAKAYEELIEKKVEHGIKHMYTFLGVDDQSLYDLLFDTFKEFDSDGTLICSPGVLKLVDGPNCHYKCSTAGGSSGGPILLTHLPRYVVGIHDGGMRPIMWDKDCNIGTSTDSDAFVQCYAKHVLPRLPSKDNAFWDGWNLEPFQRWLRRHGLQWKTDRTDHEDVDDEVFTVAS